MITIGTDCSGIDAPIQALLQLGILFRHVFSCENDPYCQETLQANYHPEHFFTDMTTRNVSSLAYVDIYVCGFPCQPFSSAGKRQGEQDEKGRGHIFWYCLEVIQHIKPKCVILENVKGLLTIDNGETFETILEQLTLLSYRVYWNIVNTKDYGIPHQRERLYIIALQPHLGEFTWPRELPMQSLLTYIDQSDDEKQPIPPFVKKANMFKYLPKQSCFVDIGFPYKNFPKSDSVCPCITTQGNLWCVPYCRKANCNEYVALQGFPSSFKQVVSDRQFKKQLGNSMSVNVLKELFKQILPLLE